MKKRMKKARKPATKNWECSISMIPTSPPTTVINGDIVGVKWDKEALSTLHTVANGLVENAMALGRLALLFTATNLKVDNMVHIAKDGSVAINGNITHPGTWTCECQTT